MAIARSKLTAQSQISVPADVRRKLGVGPGSVLEWEEDGNQIVVVARDASTPKISTGCYLGRIHPKDEASLK